MIRSMRALRPVPAPDRCAIDPRSKVDGRQLDAAGSGRGAGTRRSFEEGPIPDRRP